MSRNVHYKTAAIASYYGEHRRSWEELYPSERWVFERVAAEQRRLGHVLDVGCAAGGLGLALSSRFAVDSYTGLDISNGAIAAAQERTADFKVPVEFAATDVCEWQRPQGRKPFDVVTALSVVDWNTDASGILEACWSHVAPGGRLVISLRLTDAATVCDAAKSYQYIWFESGVPPEGTETAQYTVFNAWDALKLVGTLRPAPAHILAYGYWGKPSAAARTPFDRLLFSVLAITKSPEIGQNSEPRVELHWPLQLFGT